MYCNPFSNPNAVPWYGALYQDVVIVTFSEWRNLVWLVMDRR